MAQKSDKSPAFTLVVAILLLLLVGAGSVAWLQSSGSDEAGNAERASLAALSQAIPLHASRTVAGDEAALERLASDLGRLDEIRASGSPLPGNASDWDALQRHGNAIRQHRSARQAVVAALTSVDEALPALLNATETLTQESGATAAIESLEERAEAVRTAIGSLLVGTATETTVETMTADVAAMREVGKALAGEETELDIAAVAGERRDELLTPVSNAISEIESAAAAAASNAANAADASGDVDALGAAADSLRAALTAEGTPDGATVLYEAWLVPALLAAALLAVIGLAVMHAQSAVFERAAKIHAEQNDRNQQAILRLLDELGSLADGDLTVEATVTEDITGAIADSINYAIEKLRELVATINETAIMVDSAAKQTKNTAVHMARAADNQGREIRAATESIDSMASSIEEVSGNAERSSDVARHSVDVAHKGGEAVRRTIDGMNTIRETIQETSKRIKRLGESSQEIGNIIELINDIAEQTNILALNASIQASMAGEAGRGFAVVADEVQRLAERSTNATKQIEVLVRTIQTDTNEAVVSMERSTTDVVGGALLAENAGAALDEIEQVSNQIANLVQNISGSAREQASSAADVTRRTTKLKEISEQTGKATSATAAAISKLSVLASQLRETVAGFTLPSSAVKPGALANPPHTSPQRVEEEAAG
jgi:twitching motility protein PilJ